jgi:hypothetical protein
MRFLLLLCLTIGPLLAQDLKLPASLNKLEAKASEVVNITLDGDTLRLAGKFLSGGKPDDVRVKNFLAGLKGIYVRSFEFNKEGEYSPDELDAIRSQVRGPGWSRLLGVLSKKDNETCEIYMKVEGDRAAGLVILAAEPKELTVVNIVGAVNLEDLSRMGGHFGIPQVEVQREDKKAGKE